MRRVEVPSASTLVGHLHDPRTGAVRGPVWVGLSSLLTGSATYAVLIVIARVIGPVSYADFAVFWSFMVIASFGVFLPVEQEVARRTARDLAGSGPIGRRALLVSSGYAVVLVAVGSLLWRVFLTRVRPETSVVVALVLLCGALSTQFSARGILSGRLHLKAYATVAGLDSVVRLLLVLVLAVAGARSVGSYAMAIALSATSAAALAWWLVLRRPPVTELVPTEGPEPSMVVRTSGLIVGALCMQLLLNSGPLIARGVASGDEALLAGQLLAAMTLARVPVFVLQSLQATYLARVAGHSRDRRPDLLRRTVGVLATLVGGVAVVTVGLALACGPLLTRLIYGSAFQISREAAVLVALGVSLYVVASVSNDVNIALGLHLRVTLTWLGALVVGVLVVAVSGSLLAKSTLPLVVAAVVAGTSLVWGVVLATRRLAS